MFIDVLVVIILGWGVIYPGTDFFVRFLWQGTLRRRYTGRKTIWLTFDDGPDPDYTPRVLQVLAEHHVTASFFLVAQKAERHPELVATILNAGHSIGLHTYYHRHAYLMMASISRETMYRAQEVLEQLAGRPLNLFRPPWGAMNLFQYRAAKRLGLQIVLWSANAQDWKLGTGKEGIIRRLQQRVSDGAVIVLHDSGGDRGAPENTIHALPEIIVYFKTQGYRFANPDDSGGMN